MEVENIKNEEAFINLLSDLEFILIKDGREIPPENQKCFFFGRIETRKYTFEIF